MLVLSGFIKKFQEEAIMHVKRSKEHDDVAIEFLDNQKCYKNNNHFESWCKRYKVFLGLKKEVRESILEEIKKFYGEKDNYSEENLVRRFILFEDRIAGCCPSNKNGKPRNVTCLTSKALWLCYPDETPIFDSFAQRTLHVISKLVPPDKEASGSAYEKFYSIWMKLYTACEGFIDEEGMDGNLNKVRIFDKILWLAGKPKFGFSA